MTFDAQTVKGDAGSYRLVLSGRLDNAATPMLNARIAAVLEDPDARVLRMELGQLIYISSSGLGAFAVARKMIVERGGAMVIIGAQPTITKVFEIVKLVPKEILVATPEEADAYLSALLKQTESAGGAGI